MRHANLSIFIPHAGCKHRCSFCNQNRISGQNSAPSIEQVTQLIQTCAESSGHHPDSAQIAFFGGSFTCIPERQMIAYLETAARFVEAKKFKSIRISTRPDGIDDKILGLLKQYHVENIELGAQSMIPEILSRANRGHTIEDTVNAANAIRDVGFKLGLQMLVGLPGDTKELSMQTAIELAKLKPTEMRLYPVSVFPETDLFDEFRNGTYHPLSPEDAVDWIVPIADYLQKQNIKLLRIGLHQANGAVAGAFHPAFGEMVKTGLFNLQLQPLLPPPPARLAIQVPPAKLSIAIGQKRSNLDFWQSKGYQLQFGCNFKTPNIIID